MPLRELACGKSDVKDLSPLKGMRTLRILKCDHAKVVDLTPLMEVPNLEVLICDFEPERDAKVLRALKSLKKINDRPASEMLKTP